MNEREFGIKLLDSLLRARRLSEAEAQKVRARIEQIPDFESALYACTNLQAEDLRPALEEVSGTRAVDPSLMAIDPDFMANVLQLIPVHILLRESAFPIRHEGNVLSVAIFNPLDRQRLDRLEGVSGLQVVGVACHKDGVIGAHEKQCDLSGLPEGWQSHSIEELYSEVISERESVSLEELQEQALLCINVNYDALSKGGKALEIFLRRYQLIRYFHQTLVRMVRAGCSDIHIEPQEASLRIRTRIDGVLRMVAVLPASFGKPLLYRVQAMSGLETGPCAEPKDGHIGYNLVPGQAVEFRVSILPSIFGEKIVLRALRRNTKGVPIAGFGMDPEDERYVQSVIHAPNGLVLVTGPTGSGKTSTLYSVLDEINGNGVNIVTAEDPVERVIAGTTQVLCGEESKITFADALRSFLRQDPDIVMVGEIRDAETCDIALKAALTGHLVLSTLHTNDAPSAILRLLNLGMEPFTIAAALRMIVAQRLVRMLCKNCATNAPLSEEARKEILAAELKPPQELPTARGCSSCGGTGYSGRTGVFEVLRVDDAIRDAIGRRAALSEIRDLAIRAGMRPLRRRGLQLVLAGVTSIDEVCRHTLAQ